MRVRKYIQSGVGRLWRFYYRDVVILWTLVTTFVHESLHVYFAAPWASQVRIDVYPHQGVVNAKTAWKDSTGRLPRVLSAVGPLITGILVIAGAAWSGVLWTPTLGDWSEIAAFAILAIWWLSIFHLSPNDVSAALASEPTNAEKDSGNGVSVDD